ncbi:MAG: peptidase M48 [Gammaproteobacteria bacterium]|nr:MAG: peptidase M48 [Gammaproteobacteria bacterium]
MVIAVPRILLVILLSWALPVGAGPLFAVEAQPESGREMHEQIVANMPLVEGELADYVNQVGQRIARHSDQPEETFTFTVIDNPVINAFALPDGYIYIHRGLINYLNNEAQLAAVLAHEIGHVTAKHHSRQKRAHISSAIFSGLLAVLTRSRDVGEASALWGASMVSGYGRDMELEADEVGSRYLYQSGYDPQAMIEVITLLKNHELLEKKRALEAGREPQFYHGLFATHPRNDQRLREVVSKAGQSPGTDDGERNVTAFRLATEGMVWGENFAERKLPNNAYLNEELAFLLYIPRDWTSNEGSPVVTVRNPDGSAQLSVTVQMRTKDNPDQFIKKQLGIPLLKKSEALQQFRLRGHTGLIPDPEGHGDQRLAVIYYGYRAFVFRGNTDSANAPNGADSDFTAIIASFRPVSRQSVAPREPKNIHYVRATEHTTFALLAAHLKLGKQGEDELRIINNFYPVGEPKPGQWIKIIR